MQQSLSAALTDALNEKLNGCGDPGPIKNIARVGGGDINEAARIDTAQASYFVKWHRNPPPRFFVCEARGLRLLAEPGRIQVPEVIAQGDVPGSQTSFLILRWVDRGTGKNARAAEQLGWQLAELHRKSYKNYGLDHDNYIGRLPQPNAQTDSWVAFYRDQRLGAQRDQARQNGRLPTQRSAMLERLMQNLDRWIDESTCQPSLLHGDLWGGNWLVDAGGQPVVIDPAVYFGDREADLAMTALFGGFPASFYRAYDEVFPLAPGYEERQPLYKLYYLLCHLNLFGEGYGGSVDTILRRYVE